MDNNIHNSICNHVNLWNSILLYIIAMKKKVVCKATRADISMNTDTELQKKILKTIAWSLGLGTIGFILLLNLIL